MDNWRHRIVGDAFPPNELAETIRQDYQRRRGARERLADDYDQARARQVIAESQAAGRHDNIVDADTTTAWGLAAAEPGGVALRGFGFERPDMPEHT